MKRSIKFAVFGGVIGLSVALMLANMASDRSLSPLLILTLWPTAIFGLGATGWSDGAVFHVFQGFVVFGGNALVYATVFYFLGLIGTGKRDDERAPDV